MGFLLLRCLFNEIRYHPGKVLTAVFLQEMGSALDDRMRLPLGPGYLLLKYAMAAAGYRIAVAEGGQKRFVEL